MKSLEKWGPLLMMVKSRPQPKIFDILRTLMSFLRKQESGIFGSLFSQGQAWIPVFTGMTKFCSPRNVKRKFSDLTMLGFNVGKKHTIQQIGFMQHQGKGYDAK